MPEGTVVVTGASGTVGSAVVRRLARDGAKVRAMFRSSGVDAPPGVEWVKADLEDRSALARAVAGADIVVHCAASLTDDWDECGRTNIEGVRNLLAAVRESGNTYLVHISTVSVYDDRTLTHFDESSPTWTEELNAYGFTKAEGERLVTAAASRGVQSAILRPVVVLSMHPRSYWGPLAVERARASAEPLVPVSEVPYVHEENLADAVVLAARRRPPAGRAYNVIDRAGDAHEYLRAVYTVVGEPMRGLPPDAPKVTYAGDRIRRELGYAPVIAGGASWRTSHPCRAPREEHHPRVPQTPALDEVMPKRARIPRAGLRARSAVGRVGTRSTADFRRASSKKQLLWYLNSRKDVRV